MELYSDQPGVQFYTANYVKNIIGKLNSVYSLWSGFCLET
jgi:aldose 1-epimerase